MGENSHARRGTANLEIIEILPAGPPTVSSALMMPLYYFEMVDRSHALVSTRTTYLVEVVMLVRRMSWR